MRAELVYIGQISECALPNGGYGLRHRERCRAIAGGIVHAHGSRGRRRSSRFAMTPATYRPLKTAPNLRRGWRLDRAGRGGAAAGAGSVLPGDDSVRGGRFESGRLVVTPLRETLARQSGMYRVTAKITDEQADALVGRFCRSDGGCLRTILWRRNAAGAVASTRLPAEKFDPARLTRRRGKSDRAGFCPVASARKRATCSWPRCARS